MQQQQSQFYEKPIEYMYYVYEVSIIPFEWIVFRLSSEKIIQKNIYTVRRRPFKKHLNNRKCRRK
jgi:hypothetical protein